MGETLRLSSTKSRGLSKDRALIALGATLNRDAPVKSRSQPLIAAGASSHDARAQRLLRGVSLECETDETIEERRVRQSGRLPHARVHAHRREPGNGVDLVEKRLAGF